MRPLENRHSPAAIENIQLVIWHLLVVAANDGEAYRFFMEGFTLSPIHSHKLHLR